MAKRKQEEAGGGGAPEWMSTYGDMVTLLMCFFVLLFAMSTVDAVKFQQLAASFAGTSSSASLLNNGTTILEMMGNGIMQFPVPPTDKLPDSADVDVGEEPLGTEEELTQLEKSKAALAKGELSGMVDEFMTYFADNLLMESIEIEQNEQYVEITMYGGLTFASGSHLLTNDGREILRQIVPVLMEYGENDIMIEGYTDNVPLGAALSPVYVSNRMLSCYRANEVLEFFESEGVDPYRMRAVGMGELNPIGDNNTDEGRQLNRRVEIKIYSKLYSGGE